MKYLTNVLYNTGSRTTPLQSKCLCAGNLSAFLVWDYVLPEGSAWYSQCSKHAIRKPIVTSDRTLFICCLTTLSVVQIIWSGMIGWLFSDELDGVWKEVLVPYLRHHLGICRELLRKTNRNSTRTVCSRDEIWTFRIRAGVPPIWTPRWLTERFRFPSKYEPCYNTA